MPVSLHILPVPWGRLCYQGVCSDGNQTGLKCKLPLNIPSVLTSKNSKAVPPAHISPCTSQRHTAHHSVGTGAEDRGREGEEQGKKDERMRLRAAAIYFPSSVPTTPFLLPQESQEQALVWKLNDNSPPQRGAVTGTRGRGFHHCRQP